MEWPSADVGDNVGSLVFAYPSPNTFSLRLSTQR